MKKFVFMLVENIVIGLIVGYCLLHYGYLEQAASIGIMILVWIAADITWDYGVVPLYKQYKARKQVMGDN